MSDDEDHGPWTPWLRVTERRWVRARRYSVDEPCGVLLFETTNPVNGHGPNEDDIELEGSVRFDGCCNFSGGDHGALHLCSFAEADELRLCVQAAYSLADAMIDMDECAGDIPPFVEWQDPNAQHPEAIEA